MLRCLLLLLLGRVAADGFFLPPKGQKEGAELALIFIQGASSPVEGYRPLLEAIQEASAQRIWVGVPQHLLDIAEIQFQEKLEEMLDRMVKARSAYKDLLYKRCGVEEEKREEKRCHTVKIDVKRPRVLHVCTILNKTLRSYECKSTMSRRV